MIGASFRLTPYFFGLFAAVFYGSFRLSRRSSVPKSDRALLSSCLVSLVHGIPAGLIAAIQVQDAFPVKIDATNEPQQESLLQYTLAYMLADTALYLVPYTPTDFLFCTHHVVVIVYVATALGLGRGGISCIIMLFLGECTSLLQNSWYICKIYRGQSQLARRSLDWLGLVYPAAYVLARSLVGPPAVYWICRQLLAADIPQSCRYTWLGICAVSLAGSQLWSFGLLKDVITRSRSKQQLAEKIS